MEPHPPATWQEAEQEGTRLRLEGRFAEAVTVYRNAVTRFPRNVVLLNGLGLALMDAGATVEARSAFESAVACSPQTPALLFNLANALRLQGSIAEAVAGYRQAIALGLFRPEVYNNLGIALQTVEQWPEALQAFREALKRDPRYLPALANAGHALIEMGSPGEAIEPLRLAVASEPAYADAHWLLSHALLVTGRWPDGWDEYEWRWHKMPSAPYHRGTPQSWWRGENIAGKRILLYAEQGIGDAVQFVRYAPLVAAQGAEVLVECHDVLVDLLRTVDGVAEVYARGSAGIDYDVACPLLSLPAVFRTTIETVPEAVPYVHVDASKVAAWRERLASFSDRKRVGIVWAGNPGHVNDRKRSIQPDALLPLADVPGVVLFNLQKGGNGGGLDVSAGALPLVDWMDDCRTFGDTAALMHELDLVITVDTAVAHVGGALGVPVWMMVPFTPDWRWFLGSSNSPWYPSMRLFRQRIAGGWGDVVSALSQALVEFSQRPR
jgi:tetratricopeptide (TPR) repeat protein